MQTSTLKPLHHASHGTWAVPPPTPDMSHWPLSPVDAKALPNHGSQPLPLACIPEEQAEAGLPTLRLDRIDLDFHSQDKHFGEPADAFFKTHQAALSLIRANDLLSEWRERTWPDQQPGEMLVTKLPPDGGKHYWLVRPPFVAGGSLERGRGLIPAFRVFCKDGSLVVLGFEPRLNVPPGPHEHLVQGVFWINSRRPGMEQADIKALHEVRHFAPSTTSRTAEWRKYLDWREKVTEANSKHRYPYKEWECWHNQKGARFFLTAPWPVELLKVRFQSQLLVAHSRNPEMPANELGLKESSRKRPAKVAAAGTYQRIEPLEGGKHRQSGAGNWRLRTAQDGSGDPPPHTELVAVDVTLTEEHRERLKEGNNENLFPAPGELAVDVSGELATIRYQREAIDRLEQGQTVNPYLTRWLFDSQQARTLEPRPEVIITDARLNPEQRDSVSRALAAPDVFYLQGPPGTGKTTVIGELSRQMIRGRRRTLIASQANLAVDNALAGLIPAGQSAPELRPLRLMDERREGEMDEAFKCYLKKSVVVHWLGRVAASCEAELSKTPCAGAAKWQGLQRRWVRWLKENSHADNCEEMRQLYVRHANVIGATCNRTGKIDFYRSSEFDPAFDLVVVDEVSKATPPELLMPLLLGRRAVLVGDHRQLPPMFRSDSFEEAVANGELEPGDLAEFKHLVTSSFFEDQFISAPKSLRNTLTEQYRMHPHIMDTVNHFYPDAQNKGILKEGGGREHLHRLRQHQITLKGHGPQPLLRNDQHVIWLDSTHDEDDQPVSEGDKRGTSRWNPFEAELIAEFLGQLDAERKARAGVNTTKLDVGVISFYLAQTNELRDRLTNRNAWSHLDVQVNTVDQFQGRECSIVIVSLVRCGEVSGEFVKDYRRINVAFSRAKNLLVIVGCKAAFGRADVPISPVEGGDPRSTKVYQEIGNLVAGRGGVRAPRQILGNR